ncbi:MAG: F0F1 ATP synthase subunit B [Chloroflexi bacterium]|nr:F0F1 ATP synthase subunit B [Chloroflexota bacterium]
MLLAPLLAEETGIGALGIDVGSLIVYLINFGVLLAVLYFFAYKRVLGMLDQRSGRIKESLEEADRVREESQQQQASMQQALNEGRQEGQRVLVEARQMAERYREDQQASARAEAEAFKESARDEIRQERDAALEQVRRQFAILAVTAAERIISRSLDADAHKDLIDEVLTQGGALSSSEGSSGG